MQDLLLLSLQGFFHYRQSCRNIGRTRAALSGSTASLRGLASRMSREQHNAKAHDSSNACLPHLQISPSLVKKLAVVIRTRCKQLRSKPPTEPLIKGRNSQGSGSKPFL